MLSGTPSEPNETIGELLKRFSKGSIRQRRNLIEILESRSDDLAEFGLNVLEPFDPNGDDWGAGWILQVLNRHHPKSLQNIVGNSFGWFEAPSAVGIDYGQFQDHLLKENFEEADRFSSAVLRELVGKQAQDRGYIYYSEVKTIPEIDLTSLDRLWTAYSQGRFGFSVQARLLSSLGGRYDKLWKKIGWKEDGVWTRYPGAFNWSLKAPEGHMPLTNQLRGVRLLDALLNHPALIKRK